MCTPIQAGSQEVDLQLSDRAANRVAGYSPTSNISFSSVLQSDGSMAIELDIGKKTIHIDHSSTGSLVRLGMEVAGKPGGSLTKRELRALQRLYETLATELEPPNDLEMKLLKSIDAIVTMVPPGQRLDNKPSPLQQGKSLATPQAITMICKERGGCGWASYSDNKGYHSVNVIVGDPASSCLGRCGAGCDGASNKPLVYTQECLNHDICIKKWGTRGFLGNKYGKDDQCEDEFDAAISSYLRGDNCSHFLRGKWSVTKRGIINSKGNRFKATWLIDDVPYDDGRISQYLEECTGGVCQGGVWYRGNSNGDYFSARLGGYKYLNKDNNRFLFDLALGGIVREDRSDKLVAASWVATHTSIFTGYPLQCGVDAYPE